MPAQRVNVTQLHPHGLEPGREHTEIEEELHERAHIDYDRVAIVSINAALLDMKLKGTRRLPIHQWLNYTKMHWCLRMDQPLPHREPCQPTREQKLAAVPRTSGSCKNPAQTKKSGGDQSTDPCPLM
jgi:hypothetical protein